MIILLGTISYATFPKEEMPEIDLKTVAVIINYDGMSSNEIEKLITEPLERKLMTLKDIKEIISISKDNIASFMVAFNLDTENENLAKLVRNTITDASDNVFSLFKTKSISANGTTELLSAPLVLEESEILKVTAATANRLHVVLSALQSKPREVTT